MVMMLFNNGWILNMFLWRRYVGSRKQPLLILLLHAWQAVELIYPVDCLKWYPVSTAVNNSRNKSPDCIKEIDPRLLHI